MKTEILTEKKQVRGFIFLMALMYMTSYLTRVDYSVVIADMVRAEGLEKSLLSIALTGNFITYGAGQLVSGYFGDRIQPKKLLQGGLIVTILMNLLIPICKNPYQMAVVWCVNGFAQAFMWPPMVRMLAAKLSELDYQRACVRVSFGSLSAMILLYLFSPLIIHISGWRTVFLFSAAIGILMAVIWQKYAVFIEMEAPKEREQENGKRFFPAVLVVAMAAIVLQGILRDGITTWMPSYISETYHLSSSISILTGVILPIFSIGCQFFAGWVYRTRLQNPMTCGGAFFGLGVLSAAALILCTGKSPAGSVLFSAILTGCMHGVNLILICMIPVHFQKYGCVSLISGVLNSCTYIGSAISSYGFAKISEVAGWNATVISWSVVALLGGILCFGGAKAYREKVMK